VEYARTDEELRDLLAASRDGLARARRTLSCPLLLLLQLLRRHGNWPCKGSGTHDSVRLHPGAAPALHSHAQTVPLPVQSATRLTCIVPGGRAGSGRVWQQLVHALPGDVPPFLPPERPGAASLPPHLRTTRCKVIQLCTACAPSLAALYMCGGFASTSPSASARGRRVPGAANRVTPRCRPSRFCRTVTSSASLQWP